MGGDEQPGSSQSLPPQPGLSVPMEQPSAPTRPSLKRRRPAQISIEEKILNVLQGFRIPRDDADSCFYFAVSFSPLLLKLDEDTREVAKREMRDVLIRRLSQRQPVLPQQSTATSRQVPPISFEKILNVLQGFHTPCDDVDACFYFTVSLFPLLLKLDEDIREVAKREMHDVLIRRLFEAKDNQYSYNLLL